MITCLICKKSKSENNFPGVRYGELAICTDCQETKEAIELKEKVKKSQEEQWAKQDEYEQEKQKRIKNQYYEGQYDWM